MSARYYPRVLVAGNQVPHLRTPSAILLHRMFQDWPADRLMALGPDYHPEAKRLSCRYERWEPRWARLEHSRLHHIARALRTAGILPLDRPADLARRIAPFQPDVIVTLMEFQHHYAAALALARHLGRPFVLLVHDMPELFETHPKWADGAHERRARSTYQLADLRLPISAAMEAELFRRWDRHGVVVHPIPSDDQGDLKTAPQPDANRAFTIGYAGSLDSRYAPLLAATAQQLERQSMNLNVYSAQAPQWQSANTAHRGFHTPDALWPLVTAECDAVVLPLQPSDERDRRIIEFSFPSKLPEYLRLGLPVILAAPERSAVFEWARAHAGACITTTPDAPSIADACRRLRDHPDLRRDAGAAARLAYAREFEPSRMREQFRELLAGVVDEQLVTDGARE